MSRSTIFNEKPARFFTGDDKAYRPVRASHLVTHTNFLYTDEDHSRGCPIAQTLSPEKKKQVLAYSQMRSDSDDFGIPRKKHSDFSRRTQCSSFDILFFNPNYSEEQEHPTINRKNRAQASSLNTIGQPLTHSESKPSKRLYPNRTSSLSTKSAFTYF